MTTDPPPLTIDDIDIEAELARTLEMQREFERKIAEIKRGWGPSLAQRKSPAPRRGKRGPALPQDLEALDEMTEINGRLAMEAAARAMVRPPIGTETPEQIESHDRDIDDFTRSVEAVCQSILAKSRIRMDPARQGKPRVESPAARKRKDPFWRKRQRRQEMQVRSIATMVVSASQPRKTLNAAAEIGKWIIGHSLQPDFPDRPAGALVAALCRDFGLDPDWERWQGQNWIGDAKAAWAGFGREKG